MVAGRYRLSTLIASGGMGRVWRAYDEVLDRPVAVKELLPPAGVPVADRRTAQLAILREARAAARLEHPGVVRIYDALHVTGRTWIVMEYVESRSLQQRLADDGPLPHREAAAVGLAVLQALRAAHDAGVVHHDVKPANVLLAADGRIMLTDFGLATLDAAPTGDGTWTAPLLGSPHYIAPERLRGDDTAGVSSDLWSLGATLYTAVEGRPPFDRSSVAESLAATLVDSPDPPQHPGALHPVIAALMNRNPAERATAKKTHDALRNVTNRAMGVFAVPAPRRPPDDNIRFRPAVAAAPVAAAPPTSPLADEPEQTAPAHPSGKRIAAASISAALLVLAGSAVAVSQLSDSRHDGAQPAGTGPPTGTTAARSTSACGSATRQPLSTAAAPSAAETVPAGWRSYRDVTDFVVSAPSDWTRSQTGSVVCLDAPGDTASFTVSARPGDREDPLRHWQAAERAVISAATLPGYQRIAMGVLLVTGGGADWEYSWQPATGQRLHTRRILLNADGPRTFELSWTSRDRDWTTDIRIQRQVLASLRDLSARTPTWTVPAPQ
ncbi:serine/threonine-protein kinase [Actinoplanes sp. Pm04-4]|uniref:non-specific serine/threonine protein kinase n=1 Tax=Paractinoplanes pyxinae TaxID=2997416 RepID=A0ABT4BDQ8_9ACTN|nr:serine/threonine-protein kinase [Actinoplanes pyxinae]MCY1143730.1 serine/threonine-protein kinase [Actinoplanes pyxinae]